MSACAATTCPGIHMTDSPTPTTPPLATRPVAYRLLMAASGLCMVMFGAVQVMPAVCLEALGEDLHLDLTHRGFLMSLRLAALTACLLVVGHFAERPAKRHILFWGLLATALGQLAIAYAPNYSNLIWAILLSGLGFGVVEAILNPLVAQLNPTRCAWALNLLNGMFSFGLVLGAICTGELLQRGFGWRLSFWLWAIPPLVCAVMYLTPRYPQPAHDAEGPVAQPGYSAFLRNPLVWLLVVAMIMGGGCESGLALWGPNFCAKVLNADPRQGAWATIFYGTCMGIGRVGSGFIVVRLGAFRLMLVSALLCGIVTLGLIFVGTLPVAWTLFGLSGLFVACFWPTLLAIASEHIAIGSTSLFSLLAAAGVTGCVIFPWVIGALGDKFDLRHAVLVLPASMAILVGTLLWARLYAKKEPTQTAVECATLKAPGGL
jgi:predicted MFS family arabinose efflux permease